MCDLNKTVGIKAEIGIFFPFRIKLKNKGMLTQMVSCEVPVYAYRTRSQKSLAEMVGFLVVGLNYIRLKANSKPIGLGFHEHIIWKKF